jgi:hypothetical protein
MPKTINPVNKAGVLNDLKRGLTTAQALRNNGYAETTITRSTTLKVVKQCKEEIMAELKAKDLNADYFINKVEEQVISQTQDPDIKRKGIVDQARFAGIDKQQQITNVWNIGNMDEKDTEILTKMARRRTSG